MPDDRYREPGWKSEPSPAGLQRDLRAQFDPDEETDASFRRPRTAAGVGVPLRTATPATGIPGLVERVTSRPVRAPVRARSPVAGELVVADGVPQLAPAGPDQTGVHELERMARENVNLAPLAGPLERLLRRTREQSKSQVQLVSLVREVLQRDAERDEAERERQRLETDSRRKARTTLIVSILGVIVPTLAAIAAIIAALHGAPQPAPAVDPSHQVPR